MCATAGVRLVAEYFGERSTKAGRKSRDVLYAVSNIRNLDRIRQDGSLWVLSVHACEEQDLSVLLIEDLHGVLIEGKNYILSFHVNQDPSCRRGHLRDSLAKLPTWDK